MSYKLKAGQPAAISSAVFGDRQFIGKVSFISPVADANHNYQVDLIIANTEGISLKGGTDVQVVFNTGTPVEALLIPKSALMSDAKEPYVFMDKNGKAKIKVIKTGRMMGGLVEVLSGLEQGQRIITSGQINLKEGSPLRIIK